MRNPESTPATPSIEPKAFLTPVRKLPASLQSQPGASACKLPANRIEKAVTVDQVRQQAMVFGPFIPG